MPNEYTPDQVSPPRETLREILEERGITLGLLAKRMEVPTEVVNRLLHSDLKITEGIAERLGKALGPSADFWLTLERNYRKHLETSIGILDQLQLMSQRDRKFMVWEIITRWCIQCGTELPEWGDCSECKAPRFIAQVDYDALRKKLEEGPK